MCRETVVGEDNLYPLEPPHWLCLTLCAPEESWDSPDCVSLGARLKLFLPERPAWHFLQIKGQLEHSFGFSALWPMSEHCNFACDIGYCQLSGRGHLQILWSFVNFAVTPSPKWRRFRSFFLLLHL